MTQEDKMKAVQSAANEYGIGCTFDVKIHGYLSQGFIEGATSQAAKEYWLDIDKEKLIDEFRSYRVTEFNNGTVLTPIQIVDWFINQFKNKK